MFAVEHTGVRPDIVTIAKGAASGLPLSGMLARAELLRAWSPGAHGGTYGGNVVSCAAALATLDVIADEGLVANAAARGHQLLDGLRKIQARHPSLGDVRGHGCMVGLEFVRPASEGDRIPDPRMAHAVLSAALQRHLIALSAGTWGQVVRLIPPLVTTATEVDQAVAIMADALTDAGA